MKLASYGMREWLGGGIIFLFLFVCSAAVAEFANFAIGATLAALCVLFWLALAAFFRDPNRTIPSEPNIFVSPADGVVKDIELISGAEENNFFEGRNAVRIGIFLSVFDVHLNRAPCAMSVLDISRREGAFHDARAAAASSENEAATISGTAPFRDGEIRLIVRQIAGAVAKKIVCRAEKGKSLQRGEKFGMIKFGSRTELFLPARQDIEVAVHVGERVRAGETVIARFRRPEEVQK